MPEYSYNHRQVMAAETTLWNVVEILSDCDCGAWSQRVRELRDAASKLAAELRDYNDQWEEGEDDQ